jgi:hypothetical protein
MKKTLPIFAFSIILIVALACTHNTVILPKVPAKDTTKVIDPPKDTTAVIDTSHTMIEDTSVCFQRDVLPIFLNSCGMSGCHNATSKKKGYDLTSYSTITKYGLTKWNPGSSLLYTICASKKMPKSPIPYLDSPKLAMIWIWIAKGAPNDTNCAVVCDTTKFTYSNAVVPILSSFCYSCHSAASASSSGGNFVLDNYNNVKAQALNGNLLGDISHATGHNAMPLSGLKLSDCKITQISKWINACALNN